MEGNEGISLTYHQVREKINGEIRSNRKQGFPLPVSVLCKNVFNLLPDEFLHSINEDNFIYLILECYGDRAYLNHIKPSVYRIHDKSAWNRDNGSHRLNYQILSQYSMYKVFRWTKFEEKLAISLVKSIYSLSKLNRQNKFIYLLRESKKMDVLKYVVPTIVSMVKGKYLKH